MVGIVEQVVRDQWGRVLASLIGLLGDFDLAEEAAQEAFAALLHRLDRTDDARAAYDRALELVHSDPERRFLERRLAELQP